MVGACAEPALRAAAVRTTEKGRVRMSANVFRPFASCNAAVYRGKAPRAPTSTMAPTRQATPMASGKPRGQLCAC